MLSAHAAKLAEFKFALNSFVLVCVIVDLLARCAPQANKIFDLFCHSVIFVSHLQKKSK